MDIVFKQNPISGRERAQDKDFDEGRRVVRVVPRTPELRRYLKHGITRVGFPAEGSVEWPNDQFTKRRIREGDVTVEEAPQPQAHEGELELHPQAQQAQEEMPRSRQDKRKDALPPPTAPESAAKP